MPGMYQRPLRRSLSHRSFTRNRSGRSASQINHGRYMKKATGADAPVPFESEYTFSYFGLHSAIEHNIAKRGYERPTQIQEVAIPHIMKGKDLIGIANTGTGKTGAFLLPLIHSFYSTRRGRVLIIVPTRELAEQIRGELQLFAKDMGIYSALCIGGTSMYRQVSDLRRNPQVVIGTPGRLKDLIERRVINMSTFTHFVLDEVDRMVDMGFIQDIEYLISLLPEQRQSLFFSATIPPQINSILQKFLKDPVTVSVSTATTSENVDQDVVRIPAGTPKITVLATLLAKEEYKKVLVFTRTKRGAEGLSNSLYKQGFKTVSIHGDKPQAKRQQAIRLFKDGVAEILVATDVAARGIDIPDISHVINYDEPATFDDYIHRIGRTGRGNQKGIALTFVG